MIVDKISIYFSAGKNSDIVLSKNSSKLHSSKGSLEANVDFKGSIDNNTVLVRVQTLTEDQTYFLLCNSSLCWNYTSNVTMESSVTGLDAVIGIGKI